MMNSRALMLGVTVGFVLAWAPACSTTSCGPKTCSGCCDANGACVQRPDNENPGTCGIGGQSCANCAASGSLCDLQTFKCGAPTGGGTAADAGCPGCRLTNGVCAPGNTDNNCGLNGAACQACQGQVCTAGVCTTQTANKKVGEACTSNDECKKGLGATALCKVSTSSGNASYVGGYCTLPCQLQTECPSGSACVGAASQGEGDSICWDRCGSGDPCRQPGYACYPFNGGVCWISPPPVVDAGAPADKVGQACSAEAQCQNPPDSLGICMMRELNRTWPDGYCSKSFCATDEECSADGGALCLTFAYSGGAENRCLQRCGVNTPRDGGAADCRSGYACASFTVVYADGGEGPSSDGICLPPLAPPPERTGAPCTTDPECAVPTGAIADCIKPTTVDGGPSGFPEGYCSRLGCGADSECAADGGGICLGLSATETACYQLCATGGGGQSTCRTGYICRSYVQADAGLSVEGFCVPRCDSPGASCPTGSTCDPAGGDCH